MRLLPFIKRWGWGLQIHGVEVSGKPVSDISNVEMYALLVVVLNSAVSLTQYSKYIICI